MSASSRSRARTRTRTTRTPRRRATTSRTRRWTPAPTAALEAGMDGCEVLSMEEAAEHGDIFCTATGDKHVVSHSHMEKMKDGAILANTGHFNVEIGIAARRSLASDTRHARELVEEF